MLALYGLAIHLQEPPFGRRQLEGGFFWPSFHAAAIAVSLLIPAVWSVGPSWGRSAHFIGDPLRTVLSQVSALALLTAGAVGTMTLAEPWRGRARAGLDVAPGSR